MTTDGQARPRLSSSAGGLRRDFAPSRTTVAAALAQLSAEHRTVLHRAYYYGWSTEQIAVDLEIAEVSVKTQLHYALRTLQQTLRDMGPVP